MLVLSKYLDYLHIFPIKETWINLYIQLKQQIKVKIFKDKKMLIDQKKELCCRKMILLKTFNCLRR